MAYTMFFKSSDCSNRDHDILSSDYFLSLELSFSASSKIFFSKITTMEKDNTGVRFTEREKAVVLDLVDEWKEVVEDKKTDYGTKTKKDDAWEAIAGVFNSSDGVSVRTAKQLRDWWKNSKARSKKEVFEIMLINYYLRPLNYLNKTIYLSYIFNYR